MSEEIMTAGELMDQQFLPKVTLVDGLLTAGTYILAGTPKIGKSFFVTQLCWCVSEGVPFLGLQTHKSTVLYLALEDTPERLQGRLANMFGTDWAGTNFHLKFREDASGSELLEALREFVFFNPDTRLIVIDTLQRVRENRGTSYSYAADYDEIKPFKDFTDINNVALLLVHHTRKNTESTNPLDQISGTNGLLGAADGGFVLYKSNGQVFLDQTGRDLPSQRYVLQFDSAACLWKLIRCENKPLQENADPLLDMVDQIIDTSWCGSATEFLELIRQIDPKTSFMPNTLTRRLNSLTKRLMFEKGIEYLCSRRKEKRQILFLRKVTDDDYDANDDTFLALEIPSLPSLASSECSEQQGEG